MADSPSGTPAALRVEIPWIAKELNRLIVAGCEAASLGLFEVESGDWVQRTRANGNATAKVTIRAADGMLGEPAVMPLIEVLKMVAAGHSVVTIGRPEADAFAWYGFAWLEVHDRELSLIAKDLTGAGALLHSRAQTPTEGAPTTLGRPPMKGEALGDYLLKGVTSTWIPGLRGRVQNARARLSRDDHREIVASATSVRLDEERYGETGLSPALGWIMEEHDAKGHRLIGQAPVGIRRAEAKDRRFSIFAEYEQQLLDEVYGPDKNPRGERPPAASLDLDAGPDGAGLRGAVADRDADDPFARIEDALSLEELVRRARLTPKQSEVLMLERQGMLTEEIARRLGITATTVRRHREDALGRLRQAR